MLWRVADGEGSSRTAGVDQRKRLKASAISATESFYANLIGLSYNVNTGDITLTSPALTTVLYIKNNDDRNIVISNLIYNISNSNSTTGERIFNVIRNPTTGGIITAALPCEIGTDINANLNFNSSQTLNALCYKGATGQALVNGSRSIMTLDPLPSGRVPISPEGGIILGKGNSIAINYQPPPGNTSQKCQFAANLFVLENT